jgi:hypothetical protein
MFNVKIRTDRKPRTIDVRLDGDVSMMLCEVIAGLHELSRKSGIESDRLLDALNVKQAMLEDIKEEDTPEEDLSVLLSAYDVEKDMVSRILGKEEGPANGAERSETHIKTEDADEVNISSTEDGVHIIMRHTKEDHKWN